jgi:hypothetical protein
MRLTPHIHTHSYTHTHSYIHTGAGCRDSHGVIGVFARTRAPTTVSAFSSPSLSDAPALQWNTRRRTLLTPRQLRQPVTGNASASTHGTPRKRRPSQTLTKPPRRPQRPRSPMPLLQVRQRGRAARSASASIRDAPHGPPPLRVCVHARPCKAIAWSRVQVGRVCRYSGRGELLVRRLPCPRQVLRQRALHRSHGRRRPGRPQLRQHMVQQGWRYYIRPRRSPLGRLCLSRQTHTHTHTHARRGCDIPSPDRRRRAPRPPPHSHTASTAAAALRGRRPSHCPPVCVVTPVSVGSHDALKHTR